LSFRWKRENKQVYLDFLDEMQKVEESEIVADSVLTRLRAIVGSFRLVINSPRSLSKATECRFWCKRALGFGKKFFERYNIPQSFQTLVDLALKGEKKKQGQGPQSQSKSKSKFTQKKQKPEAEAQVAEDVSRRRTDLDGIMFQTLLDEYMFFS